MGGHERSSTNVNKQHDAGIDNEVREYHLNPRY